MHAFYLSIQLSPYSYLSIYIFICVQHFITRVSKHSIALLKRKLSQTSFCLNQASFFHERSPCEQHTSSFHSWNVTEWLYLQRIFNHLIIFSSFTELFSLSFILL